MASAVTAELRLKFKDAGATAGIDGYARHVEQATRKIEQSVGQSNTRQRQSYDRLSQAREVLGVRPEQKIQREIQQTEAAYKRLAASGRLSQNELTRAAEATRQKITRLTNEMGKLTKEQDKQARLARDTERGQRVLRGGAAAVAGVAAAGAVLQAPVSRVFNYDLELARLANVASPERDAKGRQATIANLEGTINAAVRRYGGTRDGALQTYSNLLSSGEFSNQEAQELLGLTLKGQTASGASSEDLAAILLAAKRSGISNQDLPAALSKAIKSGQLGGFELADLAKNLPALLSSARGLGVTGLSGFERVLVSAQSAVTTAGTKDEAANNLLNLLEKINSPDTAKDFDKQDIDLRKELARRVGRGQDTVSAFAGIIDDVIAKNPEARKAAADIDRLSAGTGRNDPNRRQNLEAIQKIVESSVVGRFLQDRQALQGFRAERLGAQSGLSSRVGQGVRGDNGQELQTSFDVIADRPGFKAAQVAEEAAIAQKAAVDKLIPAITRAAELFVDLSQKYPNLSAAVVGAAPPIIALGAAAGFAAIALGGQAGGGAIGRYAGKAGALLGRALPVLGAGVAGYEVGANIVKPGVDAVTQLFTGNKNDTLGTALYDLVNKPAQADPAKVDVNLTLDFAHGLEVRRRTINGSPGANVNTTTNTGNFFNGAQ